LARCFACFIYCAGVILRLSNCFTNDDIDIGISIFIYLYKQIIFTKNTNIF
jgi:hypothetical protein